MTISYTQLTEQDRVQIVNLFRSRVECRQIQAMMGLSKRAVQRVMKEAGVNTRRRNRYTLDEDYFDVIDTPGHMSVNCCGDLSRPVENPAILAG